VKLAIIGPYAPPYGGVSVHVQRMDSYLTNRNIDHVIYTDNSEGRDNLIYTGLTAKWLCKYLLTAKEDIIHFHDTGRKHVVFAGLMRCRGKQVVLTIHNERLNDQLDNSNFLLRKLIKLAIRHVSYIIIVNPRVKSLLVSIGADLGKIRVIPAYLSPVVRQEDIDEIPQDIWDFIESHNPIISANAFKIIFHKGEDLYGIDMCVDLCSELKNSYGNIGFVFALPDINNHRYFEKMQNRIKDKGIGDNFLFITKQYNFYPILMKSDLFVRPTNTDGDAVSVRESLHFRVPVVASDTVQRPDGTILFQNRNLDDFCKKLKHVLAHYEFYKKETEKIDLVNNAEHLIKVYKGLETEP